MFTYEKVQASDLPLMIEMYRTFLNDGESIIDQITEGYESEGFIGVKCVSDTGEVCGIISACKEISFTCGHNALVEEIKSSYGDEVIYTTEMIVVLPEYRHLGIAKEMVTRFGAALKATDARYFLVELWREPSGRIPGRVILGVLGGEIEHRFYPEFYRELPAYNLTCPICGVHCKCGADICVLDIRDSERKLQVGSKEEVHQN